MFTAREWTQTYEATKSRIQSTRRDGLMFTSQDTTTLQSSIDKLSAQLKMMQASPMNYEITASELARRDVLMKNLKIHLSKGKSSSSSSSRGGGSSSGSGSGSRSGGSGSGGFNGMNNDIMNPMLNSTSDAGLVQRQQYIMKQQDQMLGMCMCVCIYIYVCVRM